MDNYQIHPELEREIKKYVKSGYRVTSQTPMSAQLVRPKRFSCLLASLSFLLVGIGLIFYLFWYASQKDETIYLQVENNRVKVTRG